MKRNLLVLMIVTLLTLVVMTACSPAAKTPTAAPQTQQFQPPTLQNRKPLPSPLLPLIPQLPQPQLQPPPGN